MCVCVCVCVCNEFIYKWNAAELEIIHFRFLTDFDYKFLNQIRCHHTRMRNKL